MTKKKQLERNKPSSSPLRVEIERTRERDIGELKRLTGATNLKQLIMFSLAALAWVVTGVAKGGRVLLETSDGKLYELDAEYLTLARTTVKQKVEA